MTPAALGATAMLVAGSTLAQPTYDGARLFIIGGVQNSSDENQDFFSDDPIDPSAAPVTYADQVSIDEPLTLNGRHSLAASGTFEAIGTEWTGSGTVNATFAMGLDPSIDVPGSNPSGSGFVNQTLDFTLTRETRVQILGLVIASFDAVAAPARLDGVEFSLDRADGSSVYENSFNTFAGSGLRAVDQPLTLDPGSYSFSVAALASAIDGFGVRSSTLTYSYSIEFIPAPATGMTIALAGLVTTRRRRR